MHTCNHLGSNWITSLLTSHTYRWGHTYRRGNLRPRRQGAHGINKMTVGWLLQQENDPKHTSRLVKKWFSDQEVPVLVWSAKSPDLNPIEHLW